MKGRGIISIIVFIAVVIGVAIVLGTYNNTNTKKYGYDELVKSLKENKLSHIEFSGLYTVKFKEKGSDTVYSAKISHRTEFTKKVESLKEEYQLDIIIGFDDPSAMAVGDYIFPIIMFLMVIVMLVFLFRQIGKQNNQGVQFSKSRTKINDNIKVRFSDVAGADEEKEELAEVVEFLKNPKIYQELGARVPRGVLLVGPPGTGKTLLAKAVAGEAGVPFFSISGSDFVELYVGVGAARVRDLFEQAKRNMPSIVFIDEIDAVGRQRGAGLGGGHDEREQTLNQLLVQMDGFETTTGIIIIAATNRADILDPALLRPGRFDRQVTVHLPDVRGREEILKVHARNKPIGSDVDYKVIARITVGFTGADLENLLNEAAILAVRDSRHQINMIDLNEAINKVTMGPAKKSLLVTDSDKRVTAYHEAGHAIVSRVLKRKVHEVTIIPRGQAGGFTSFRPENDNQFITKQELLDSIAVSLGGRVAEELILENITVGAMGDIRHISSTAHKMVAELGFSDKLGPIYYGSEGEVFVGKHYQTQVTYSEETSALIDKEAASIISEQHQRATEILRGKLDLLHNFARVLLEVESIDADEVDKLVGGASPEDVIKAAGRRFEDNKRIRDNLRDNQNKSIAENKVNKIMPVTSV